MKPTLAFVFWGLSAALSAQDAVPMPSRTLLKMSPQHFVVSTFQVTTERFNRNFSRSWNVSLGVRYHEQNQTFVGPYTRGAEIDVQHRLYLRPLGPPANHNKGKYLQGIYTGFFVNGGMFSVTDIFMRSSTDGGRTWTQEGHEYDITRFAGGFTIGLQRSFWNVLAFDVFAGAGLRSAHFNFFEESRFANRVRDEVLDLGFVGFFPRIGFKVGVHL